MLPFDTAGIESVTCRQGEKLKIIVYFRAWLARAVGQLLLHPLAGPDKFRGSDKEGGGSNNSGRDDELLPVEIVGMIQHESGRSCVGGFLLMGDNHDAVSVKLIGSDFGTENYPWTDRLGGVGQPGIRQRFRRLMPEHRHRQQQEYHYDRWIRQRFHCIFLLCFVNNP